MHKVSIVIPNYNYENYLEERINSILNQTFQDFEIIFLDDSSTDNSVDKFYELIKKRSLDYNVIINDENTGNPFMQWNKGVENATGEYIWIAEADDFCSQDFLERTVEVLEQNKNVGVVYTQSSHVDEKSNDLGSIIWSVEWFKTNRWEEFFINSGRDEIENYLIFQNTIPNASAALFRKDVFLKAGKANEDFKLMGDWITWIKMLRISDVAFIPEILNYFRVHSKSMRAKYEKKRSRKFIVELYRSFKMLDNMLNLNKETKKKALNHYAKIYFYKIKNKEISLMDIKLLCFAFINDKKFFLRMFSFFRSERI